ncbi:MAG: nucleotidyltransferase domain-containing protein [Candidatus Methanogaster sp.]|uniref:Nucleotidyltransferase domain-containing protein n=1 Tax=Candidatus Methanogaster sp. TaxID=3386292 RepID=A0AC61L3L8_9EURY|nr:MAG: nucleotidyltransferase domain-containing protein [ANME-2 cluster archaeon]
MDIQKWKNNGRGGAKVNKTIKDIKPILNEAKERLQKIYGERLKGLILYGSYARGDATEGSDIDLILLLDDIINPISELEKFSGEIHQLDFLYDTVISIIPIAEGQYRRRRLPLILNAKREGIPI